MKKENAQIRIKRAYDPPDASDGTRVLVDRLWPRGLRKANAELACWLKEIAPSPGLRQWFGPDPERYAEFARQPSERRRPQLAQLGAASARTTVSPAAQEPSGNTSRTSLRQDATSGSTKVALTTRHSPWHENGIEITT